MSRKKKQPDAALEAAQNAQQAPQEIQRELWNSLGRNAAPYYDVTTGKPVEPPVVPVEINAETLYGIKPDCCDLPRLLKAILDELITQRGPIC